MSCGVCHAGGGQMEYDRNQNPYTATASTPSGDRYYWRPKNLTFAGGLVTTTMDATNKAEVDCLLCHMNVSKNGVAWLRSLGCGPANQIGPMNDPTCTGAAPYGPAFPGADVSLVGYAPGTAYDMYNRNMALKNAKLNLAASLGIGAVGTFTSGVLTGVSNMPASIAGAMISGTPNSKNCSVCHARDDSTAGLPGMMQMKYGYGNYGSLVKIGEALDTDTGAANTVEWFELGCKTGMGKRSHRIGQGPNANWGMSMFNVMFGLNKTPGAPIQSQTITGTAMPVTVVTKERMPDADIHEIRRDGTPTGIQCATCHYALGSTSLEGGSRTFPASTHNGIAYPAETVYGIDHQFAQSDSAPDTKGKNNFDGTATCESCHTTRDHPRVTSGQMNPPTPLHAGFPALHLQKIACITCHIPEVYAAPGRLKYRDWSVGDYKAGKDGAGGFRNMLDWNYDLVTGSHKTVPVLRAWITKEGETKINPFLPSVMPIWIKAGIVVGNNPAPNAGDAAYTQTAQASPVKHRDTSIAAEAAKAAGLLPNVRLNGGNMVPLFDGFSLADSWAIDTKAEIDAMLGASGFNGGASKLKLFFTPFDVTHGVAPKEWALGGTKRGGCVSCHSSANPASPNYSPNSMAFFESYQQPLNMAGQGIGQYDLLKNWFAIFADYDCTAMSNGMHYSQAMCTNMCTIMMGKSAAECAQFCAPMGAALYFADGLVPDTPQGWSDAHYFNPMTGAPIHVQRNAQGGVQLAANGSCYGDLANCDPFLTACVGMMHSNFDVMMGFPAGTSNMMGLNDGIAGLQGFTVRETLDRALHGCNPFAGPASSAVSQAFGVNVNNCMPAGAPFAGTCNASNVCVGGFRDGGGCANSGDCVGTLAASEVVHNPNGLLYSRDEMRKHFKIALQQSTGGAAYSVAASRVTFPMTGFKANPSNAAHIISGDWAQKCVDQMGMDTACTDGGYIKTTVSANDFLGYTAAQVSYLQSFVGTPINPGSTGKPMAQFSYLISGLTVTFDASAALNTTSVSWSFPGSSTVSSTTTTQAVVTYPAAGTYTATLTATNASGNSAKSMTIVLSTISMSTAPTASFSIAPYTTKTVSITDTSTGAAVVFVNWGDGTAGNLASAGSTTDHTYAANGTYKIILAARNSNGASSGAGAEVTVPVMGTISGTVSAGTGSQDAFITVYNGATLVQSVYSNATGTYTTKVPAGTYTVNATKYGFVFNSQTPVVVTAGGSATANFTALPSTVLHKISGVVDNAPAGLIVSCHPTGSAVVLGAQFTDGTGAFSFAGLADATYDIIAQPTGTHTVSQGAKLIKTISGADVVISAGTWTYQ